jgi:ATP-dependent Clp protease ATP-binding subunit ClpC
MMFLGPTGTGKTETVNLLADHYFGCREKNIIRFDMSEFMEPHTVSTLIGTPPGYIGYEEGGKLTNAVKRNPYSIILFDEIEKAHYKIFDSLLQILDDGIISDNTGNTFSFKNCIIIFTSNIGFSHKQKDTLGFKVETETPIECIYNLKNLHEELKHTFRPEFLNRIDTLLPFDYLSEETIKSIANDIINEFVIDVAKTKNIKVVICNETRQKVYEHGLDVNYGARPLRTAINKLIIDPICEEILNNRNNEWVVV